jgi:ParB/RepB/Spo0J family partition protein
MAQEITRLRDLKIGARDMFTLPLDAIVTEDNFNPRNYRLPENREHLDELKRSIRELGVQVPLLVRFDSETRSAVLVDGECRLRACRELAKEGTEIKGVPVIQVPGNNEADRLLISLTSNTGKPLSKWEIGGAFRRLIAFAWTPKQIADKTGYKERFITEAMELTDAPDDVKHLLSEAAVTPSLALSVIRKSGGKATLILREKVEKAKAAGKKTAARDTKPPRNTLKDATFALFKSLSEGEIADLDNTDVEFISVERKKLTALYKALNPAK